MTTTTLLQDAETSWTTALKDSGRRAVMEDLCKRIYDARTVLYGYSVLEMPGIDLDDEILNWTIPDVEDDLRSAVLAIAAGCYKSAGAILRSAFELSIVALYFQLRQNRSFSKSEEDEAFTKWDRGETDTPNWGTTKPLIQDSKNYQLLWKAKKINFGNELHGYFHALCSFTHNRPFARGRIRATNAINMGTFSPGFTEELFQEFTSEASKVISAILSAWLVAFPELLLNKRLLPHEKSTYERLMPGKLGEIALEFAWK